ncbi:MAG: hypothetical protein LBR20_01040 [Propionibacteriaceae bacterium]|jgi:hypothetical protein|nr:hypothetical protein [Propionibacteriaceae bacterium]
MVSKMMTEAADMLTKADRCDRCGAQAYVRVVMPKGGQLFFCRHHSKEFSPKLRQLAVTIQDESGKATLEPDRVYNDVLELDE